MISMFAYFIERHWKHSYVNDLSLSVAHVARSSDEGKKKLNLNNMIYTYIL